MRPLHLVLLLTALVFAGCQDRLEDDSSSFGLIESRIFSKSCAIPSCHASAQDATFNQHQLLLGRGTAYAQLVGVSAFQAKAKADGLIRVKAGDSESSFLFHKLHRNAGHHNDVYGQPMPIGLDKLSVGQLEFIRQWIEAGAPRTGTTGDPALLDDETPQPDYFEALTMPLNGYQVHLEPFSIAPQFEPEFYT